jgi:antitoxin MazE
MKTRLIQIGNSRGIRLPKMLIDELGLDDEVELVVRDEELVIRSADTARTGWAIAAAALAKDAPGGLIDSPTPTRFDDEEWAW